MKTLHYDAVVAGSGAAGFAAADRLVQQGVTNICLVTENVLAGTSRNTGSDKQTYYKLTLTGDMPDSVRQMAETYFAGGAMDGDLALAEAAGSARCFLHLTELGVPFPTNAYGEYVGYKTDHDPAKRATSAGPLTSKYMTEVLEAKVRRDGTLIYDRCSVVRVLAPHGFVEGVLCYSLEEHDYLLFATQNVVYATGGPAGLYLRSVYPGSQHGATGLALEAGATGKNLTEWQYGIASTKFRWNLSGTYQQVLPRYISTAQDGSDAREFLRDTMSDAEVLAMTFLKGYQWPFDPRKIDGSSRIDMLVYLETEQKGRRVFLDYTENPKNLYTDFSNVGEEAYDYLDRSDALLNTPFERLQKMNPKAVALYASHGIDLSRDWLEIAVCAQHNNGGLSGDVNWESSIRGLFPVGEVNGSHGIYRPGGSALNAGQVGSLRAAEEIGRRVREGAGPSELSSEAMKQAEERIAQLSSLPIGESNTSETRLHIGRRMSKYLAQVRELSAMEKAADQAKAEWEQYWGNCVISRERPEEDRLQALYNYDLLLAQMVYARAMADAVENDIFSRGSYVVMDGVENQPLVDDGTHNGYIQEAGLKDGEVWTRYRPVRPIPESEQWFETVYNA